MSVCLVFTFSPNVLITGLVSSPASVEICMYITLYWSDSFADLGSIEHRVCN